MPSDWLVTVITPDDANAVQPDPTERIIVRRASYAPKRWQVIANVPGGILPSIKRNPLVLFLIPIMLLSLTLKAISESRESDVVHANWAMSGIIAAIASFFSKVPYVTTLRGDDANRATSSLLFRFLLVLGIKGATKITAVSHFIAEQAKATFPELAKHVKMIANGVQDEFLNVFEKRRAQPMQEGNLRILTVGALIKRKAVEVVIFACEELSRQNIPFRLTVVGGGPELFRLEKEVSYRAIANKVEFLGSVASDDVPALMLKHDVFVLASRSEGRANVILEAMATGMAIVATDIPGTRELINSGETGILFPVDDFRRLANILAGLAVDTTQIISLGGAARKSIEDRGLLWRNTAAAYDELFRTVIAGRAA